MCGGGHHGRCRANALGASQGGASFWQDGQPPARTLRVEEVPWFALPVGHCHLEAKNGKFCLVKIINFKQKTKISDILALAYTKPQMVDWRSHVKECEKILAFCFRAHHILRSSEDGKPDAERTEDEWNYGFDFIEENGSRESVRTSS